MTIITIDNLYYNIERQLLFYTINGESFESHSLDRIRAPFPSVRQEDFNIDTSESQILVIATSNGNIIFQQLENNQFIQLTPRISLNDTTFLYQEVIKYPQIDLREINNEYEILDRISNAFDDSTIIDDTFYDEILELINEPTFSIFDDNIQEIQNRISQLPDRALRIQLEQYSRDFREIQNRISQLPNHGSRDINTEITERGSPPVTVYVSTTTSANTVIGDILRVFGPRGTISNISRTNNFFAITTNQESVNNFLELDGSILNDSHIIVSLTEPCFVLYVSNINPENNDINDIEELFGSIRSIRSISPIYNGFKITFNNQEDRDLALTYPNSRGYIMRLTENENKPIVENSLLEQSYSTYMAQVYGLPITLPEYLIIDNFKVNFIPFQEISSMLSQNQIERYIIDPILQPWSGPPLLSNIPHRIMTFFAKNGKIYLSKVRYYQTTNQIFAP